MPFTIDFNKVLDHPDHAQKHCHIEQIDANSYDSKGSSFEFIIFKWRLELNLFV